MRTAFVLVLLFQAQMALAQFWPMQRTMAPYNQAPGYGGGGYSVMPGRVMQPVPWFRQPLPYFQQPYGQYPYNMWGGGYGGYGPSPMMPQMFPNQAMSPFGMSPFMGGMNSMNQPRFGLNLFFDLDRMFGGAGGGNVFDDGAPYCEYCERRSSGPSRIRYADDYDDYDRDYDRPTHTEARERYVRQSDNYPAPPPDRSNDRSLPPQASTPAEPPDTTSPTPPPRQAPGSTAGQDKPTTVPGTSGGERVAGQEPAKRPAPAPRPGKELPPAAGPVDPRPQPGVGVDRPNPNPSGQVLIRVEARDADERLAQRQPFFQLFMRNWNACIKEGYIPEGCEPNRYAISRHGAHRVSCHGVNAAIDVHNIVCNKDFRNPHRAINNGPLWQRLIQCMGGREGGLNLSNKSRKMGVIWRQPIHSRDPDELREKHHTHAHFSPAGGCILSTGKRTW